MKSISLEEQSVTPPFSPKCNNRGFTLVELMVAMTIGAIVLAAVMSAFLSQHKSYLIQDDVVEMQQNGRAAIDLLTRDIRSAGYDPYDRNARITTATATNLVLTREDDLPPPSAENTVNALDTLSYSLFDAFLTAGTNDGLVDDLALEITPAGAGTGGRQVVAENIAQLEFVYLKDDGEVTTTASDVRAIRVSLLAVASQPDPSFNNGIDYTPSYTSPLGVVTTSALAWGPFNDNFRRRLFTTTVQCRNIGL